jgi:hypothetical protein
LADPLVLDASFQMMTLWAWEHCQTPALPCAIRRLRLFRQSFPRAGIRVVLKVHPARGPVLTARLDFYDHDRTLVAVVEDYESIQDQGLIEAFRQNRLLSV